MRFKPTLCEMHPLRSIPILFFLMLFYNLAEAQTTRVFATQISNESNTDLGANAIDGNLSSAATVRASSGLALGIGAYSGFIELEYPELLPANTTSYIKIDTDDELLPALLGGSLGGLLSNVLGTVLIGNQEFTVQAKNGDTVLLQGDSQDIGEFAAERLRIVTDESGDYFVAITPSQPYNRIRVRNRIGSLLGLFNTKHLEVYGSFYVSGIGDCGYASFTSFDGQGISLDLLNLGNAGVTNPENILDSDPNSFSRLSLGILGVAASIQQTAYFEGLAQNADEYNIRLKVDSSLLALGVANNIQIIAWNNASIVETRTLSSLLNLDLLTLLQGNQVASIPFTPNATTDRITVRYSSLLNVQLTQSLDLYDIIRVPQIPGLTDPNSQNASICSGETMTFSATTASGNEIRIYDSAQGGTLLATLASGAPFESGVLTETTSFYVAAARIGCTEESRRLRVDVEVIENPVADDISIPSILTACQGSITLAPISSIGGATIKYYTDQNKTQEITTGYSGDPGVTYVKNDVTGTLLISGLNETDSPYSYFIALTVEGLCENAIGTLKEVTVNYTESLSLTVLPEISGCGIVNLRDAIIDFDPSNTYLFFDSSSIEITTDEALEITVSGTYFIQTENPDNNCLSDMLPVVVTVNPQPTLEIESSALVTQISNSVTLNSTSTGTVVWYDSNGNALPSNSAGPFAATGVYTFTAVASIGTCSASRSVTVTVINPAECPPLLERNYANAQRWSSILTGGVSNPSNAIDGNLQTFSTVTTGIGLLGIGTTWQILEWDETIPAGTPVTVKLGSEYSGLTLIGGFSVVGTKRNSLGIPIDVGTIQAVSGSLLDLLPGQNNFEYKFVPSNVLGPQSYDGVRIIIGSLASVAQSAKVYEAYYETPVTQIACNPNDAIDVLFGAIDLGVGVLTSTVGVDNAFNSIDSNSTSYATLYSGAGILAAAEMTVVFNTPSIVGDTLQITISRPGTLLSANVLTGLSFQTISNNGIIGAPIDNSSTLLNIQLNGSGDEATLSFVPQESFDRIRIRLGGVADVLDFLRVHEVIRTANTQVLNADENNAITACQGETITLEATSILCTSFIWYDAAVGGNVVSTGNSFTIPNDLPTGTYAYYIQPVRFGCEILSRGVVTITVTETAPEDAITAVEINGTTDPTFCSETGNVTLEAILNSSMTLTNPVFYWYSFDGTQQQLIPSETNAVINLTGLIPGTYTYFVGVSSDEFCQTAEEDRTQITFTILPSSTATDIQVDNDTVCLGSIATINPSSTLTNPSFQYYFTNDTTQAITNGAVVDGITYTIEADGSLSISGLIEAGSPYTYYIAVSSATTCLNEAGNLQSVTVTVGNPDAPTAANATQTFCQANSPTLADIVINESNIIFYDAPTGGTALDLTTPLTDGIYYVTQIDGNCESDTRLAITVIIGNPATPTTNSTTQNFCQSDNPTVADIQVNETGAIFYDAQTGGTPLDPTAPLANGTYYAALVDGSCESEIRLAISVTVADPATPTTGNPSQEFCSENNPMVADLDVNEANILVYATPSGGTALAPTAPLAAGTYYVALVEGNCESAVRLEIAVSITAVPTPTANETSQTFCQADSPTVANLVINEPNVVFYDAATGGNLIAGNALLANGTYYASLQQGSCESGTRLAITVTLSNPQTPTTNSGAQNFCQSENPTIADIQVNESGVVFYDALTGGTLLDPAVALANGTYYAAMQDGDCESEIRLAISVTVADPATPTTDNAIQNFCSENNPTVADLDVNEANILVYTSPSGGTALAPTAPLVAGTYYVALVEGNCESDVRLEITVSITTVPTPTANETSQTFCQADSPTVANLVINEPNAVFYDAATGGNLIAGNALLANGIYYASLQQGSCESGTRLAITVTLSNPQTPTTNSSAQNFCQSENPTIADIQVNESGVVFYDALTGGTLLDPAVALANGTYYAAMQDGDCESEIRLAISVTVADPATPTTDNALQNFCSENNPTVADLDVNETNILVYTTPSGGTALAPTAPLAAGIYYVALVEGNCQSSVRLAITVSFLSDQQVTITGGQDQACFSEDVTYTTLAGMNDYVWDAIGGTIISGGQATDNFATVSWDVVGTGTISVAFTNTTGCSTGAFASRDIEITVCSDIIITKTVNNPTPNIDEVVVFTISVSNTGQSEFSDVVVSEALPSGYNYISSNASLGTYSPTLGIWNIPTLGIDQTAVLEISVRILPTGEYLNTATIVSSNPTDSEVGNNEASATVEPTCLIVYNEFSPNDDGANDVFRIDCIENYPNSLLQIHNRYGVTVYKTKSYQNNWDGIANMNSPINEDNKLPTGTYFYVLELGDGSKAKTGWIYLIR